MIGLSMFFSPLCANIYISCLPALKKAMNTTPQLINLTVTIYLIFQGIAPAFFGDLADNIGRRPTYIITFTVFVIANIGLALQSSYAALLALRILQSLGSSAATTIARWGIGWYRWMAMDLLAFSNSRWDFPCFIIGVLA